MQNFKLFSSTYISSVDLPTLLVFHLLLILSSKVAFGMPYCFDALPTNMPPQMQKTKQHVSFSNVLKRSTNENAIITIQLNTVNIQSKYC